MATYNVLHAKAARHGASLLHLGRDNDGLVSRDEFTEAKTPPYGFRDFHAEESAASGPIANPYVGAAGAQKPQPRLAFWDETGGEQSPQAAQALTQYEEAHELTEAEFLEEEREISHKVEELATTVDNLAEELHRTQGYVKRVLAHFSVEHEGPPEKSTRKQRKMRKMSETIADLKRQLKKKDETIRALEARLASAADGR